MLMDNRNLEYVILNYQHQGVGSIKATILCTNIMPRNRMGLRLRKLYEISFMSMRLYTYVCLNVNMYRLYTYLYKYQTCTYRRLSFLIHEILRQVDK